MIAFKAETENTFIKKSQELEDARWFDLGHPLPMRPESTAAHLVKQVFPKTTYINLKEQDKQFRMWNVLRKNLDKWSLHLKNEDAENVLSRFLIALDEILLMLEG